MRWPCAWASSSPCSAPWRLPWARGAVQGSWPQRPPEPAWRRDTRSPTTWPRPTPSSSPPPCKHRSLPTTGGVTARLRDEALTQLDAIACDKGSSREEFGLALASAEEAKRYGRRYGVNPRSLSGTAELWL